MADLPHTNAAMPIPPRFRWLKRLSLAGVVVVVLVVSLRLWWGWYEERKLEAVVNAIAARGEPIRFGDMKWPAVPDADNAAYYYRQALAQWPKVNGQLICETKWYEHPRTLPDPIRDNTAYLKQCSAAFELLAKAAAAPGCDWHYQLSHPAMDILLPGLADMRQLTDVALDAAGRAHLLGNDHLTLQIINDCWDLAAEVDGPPRSLIGALVGSSIRAGSVYRCLQPLTPTLRIGGHDPTAASPSQVRLLITHLLDERRVRTDFIGAVIGERWMDYDTAQWAIGNSRRFMALTTNSVSAPSQLTSASWPDRALLWCYRPVLVADTRSLVGGLGRLLGAARRAGTWPAYEQQVESAWWQATPRLRTRIIHPLSMIVLAPIDFAMRTWFQDVTLSRMAATALAIRLYQLDHGHRPVSLDRLVPSYLPAVPRDAMAAGDKPLGYLPQGVVPRWPSVSTATPQLRAQLTGRRFAVLYSVGRDGHDDGGQCFYEYNGTIGTWTAPENSGDAVYLLDPQP